VLKGTSTVRRGGHAIPTGSTVPTLHLCGVCGIETATIDNSAAYLESWMQVLRNDPTMLVHAAAQAQKAADYIQHRHPEVGD
jgi:antirestriction protein ArdC